MPAPRALPLARVLSAAPVLSAPLQSSSLPAEGGKVEVQLRA